jgi:hypothetical protein
MSCKASWTRSGSLELAAQKLVQTLYPHRVRPARRRVEILEVVRDEYVGLAVHGSGKNMPVLRIGLHLLLQFPWRRLRHGVRKPLVHRGDASVDVGLGQLRGFVPAHLVDDMLGPPRFENLAVGQR